MNLQRRHWLHRWIIVWTALISFGGCNLFTAENSDATAQFNNGADITWQAVSNGIDYQIMAVQTAGGADFDMHIVRIDPQQAQFSVQYQAGIARNYNDWKQVLGDDVRIFVNASFFTETNSAIGLVVQDGLVSGSTLNGYGGMFQIDASGRVQVRSLVQAPYLGEPLILAVQSFPMLVEPGGVVAATGAGFDDPARRTVIAQDFSGYIYLMSTGLFGQISFRQLQQWLVQSGLGIDVAFALDGGRSSMLFVRGNTAVEIPGFAAVSVILAVY